MRSNNSVFALGGIALLQMACHSSYALAAPPTAKAAGPDMRPTPPVRTASDRPDLAVTPYQPDGGPPMADQAASYDEVGYAGTYGQGMDGNPTASGESFRSSGVSAAHGTLPLPSYAEVTALDTGKTILVEINDRPPSSSNRIITLSPGAADQLGVAGDGAVAVRVRRVNPPEQEKAVLRSHGQAAARLDTPPALLVALRQRLGKQPVAVVTAPSRAQLVKKTKAGTGYLLPPVAAVPRKAAPPPQQSGEFIVETAGSGQASAPPAQPLARAPVAPRPEPRSAPRASAGNYIVQIAAFSTRPRAQALARRIGAHAIEAGGVWRVRYGPYPSQEAARAGVRLAATKGFENARIMANDGP